MFKPCCRCRWAPSIPFCNRPGNGRPEFLTAIMLLHRLSGRTSSRVPGGGPWSTPWQLQKRPGMHSRCRSKPSSSPLPWMLLKRLMNPPCHHYSAASGTNRPPPWKLSSAQTLHHNQHSSQQAPPALIHRMFQQRRNPRSCAWHKRFTSSSLSYCKQYPRQVAGSKTM